MRARFAHLVVAGVLTASVHGCNSASSSSDGAVDGLRRDAEAGVERDGPGQDRLHAGDLFLDAPTGADQLVVDQAGGGVDAVLDVAAPIDSAPTCATQTVVLGRPGTTSSCSFKVSSAIPRDRVNVLFGGRDFAGRARTTAPRVEVGSGSATRWPCATPPACPGRTAGPISSWRPAARRRAASWRVVRRAAAAATASTPAASAGGAPAVHVRRARVVDRPARRLPSAVPGRARTEPASAAWAALVSRRPAAPRAYAVMGAVSAPSIRSCATVVASASRIPTTAGAAAMSVRPAPGGSAP